MQKKKQEKQFIGFEFEYSTTHLKNCIFQVPSDSNIFGTIAFFEATRIQISKKSRFRMYILYFEYPKNQFFLNEYTLIRIFEICKQRHSNLRKNFVSPTIVQSERWGNCGNWRNRHCRRRLLFVRPFEPIIRILDFRISRNIQ